MDSLNSSLKELRNAAVKGTLSHAYIILSEDALIRKTLTVDISKLILCKKGGCDCNRCKKIEEGAYVDVKVFNSDGSMKVKDTEELIESAYTKGFEDDLKLYFIDNANSLSPQVQNKLLKIYEEPPQNVIMFLLAKNENGILKTIISRAAKIYIRLLTTNEVLNDLLDNGVNRETALSAAAFSGGRLDKAYEYSENGGYKDIYENVFTVLKECKNSALISAYLNNPIFSKENIALTLEFFEIILRDVLEYTSKGKSFITVSRDYDIKIISNGFNAGSVAMALECVYEAKKMLTFNVNSVTVAERLLFNVLEVKYKWRL